MKNCVLSILSLAILVVLMILVNSSAVTVLLGIVSLFPSAVFLLSMAKSFDGDYYIHIYKPDLSHREIVPA